MSKEGFGAQRRADKAAKKAAEATSKTPPLTEILADQASAMTMMAGMFIVTIGIGLWIQPFYDVDEMRAFGPEGATQAGWIFVELIFIFIFTASIIWMARKGLQKFIRGGVLFVLWAALLLALTPICYYLLMEDVPSLDLSDEETADLWVLQVDESPDTFYAMDLDCDAPECANGTLVKMQNAGRAGGGVGESAGATTLWSYDIIHQENQQSKIVPAQIVNEGDALVLCEGTQWVRLDANTGDLIDNHTTDCNLGFRYTDPDPDWENCHGAEEGQDWAIVGSTLVAIDRWGPENPLRCENWNLFLPVEFDSSKILIARKIGSDHLLLVTQTWAGMIIIPKTAALAHGEQATINTTWDITPRSGEEILAATIGTPPGYELGGDTDPILILGTIGGSVTGWNIPSNGTVTSYDAIRFDELGAFDEPIRGLILADCCSGGSNDLWVVEGDQLRAFTYVSLAEMTRPMTVPGTAPVLLTMRAEPNPEWEEEGWSDSILTIEQGGEWSSAHWVHDPAVPDFAIGGAGLFYADALAILLSIGFMVALIRYPEWYVVNAVGILVGAGVITILGVSFDEWLIILFMVLAAAYDAWAVYRSKHMLELADTMIGLKLPILLVAPQDKEYSFIAEGEQAMSETPEPAPIAAAEGDGQGAGTQASEAWKAAADSAPPPPKPTRSGGEAMFMGLGDVIFPGMLAISALTWLPAYAGPMGISAPLWVAIFTTIGGLAGYLILMTYVARGKPQAGLPLLNGGSILGYIISASILIGYKAFEFNITLF